MVIESIECPTSAERSPWQLFFLGFLYSSAALFLSYWIFRSYESLVMIFFTVMASASLIYYIMRYEEKKLVCMESEQSVLKEHKKAISVFLFLFCGFAIAFALWYVVLPSGMVQSIFSEQIATIGGINKGATGNVLVDARHIGLIFLNNFRVLLFCLLFAFLYGVGAIFILTWNASVIGAAMGDFIRVNLARAATGLGFVNAAAYFKIISLSIIRYVIHGIPEIAAYFVAGLAGSIISVSVINHDLTTKNFQKILLDTSNLILIALLILFAAALLEVYVTPAIFSALV